MLRYRFEAAVAAGNWDVANASHELVRKSTLLSEVFERGRAESDRKRQVPEWAVDDISFCVMVDPVMVSRPPARRAPRPSDGAHDGA